MLIEIYKSHCIELPLTSAVLFQLTRSGRQRRRWTRWKLSAFWQSAINVSVQQSLVLASVSHRLCVACAVLGVGRDVGPRRDVAKTEVLEPDFSEDLLEAPESV